MDDDNIRWADICENCANQKYFPVQKPCVQCIQAYDMGIRGTVLGVTGLCYVRRIKTQRERLHQMSDVELANWLSDQIVDRNIGVTPEGWLEYLRSEGSTG